MKLDFFGFTQEPFRISAEAYAGPQQLALAGGLKRALAAPDSVVTVAGPVGVGKTVSVNQAVERTGPNRAVARIGRMYLQRDEVLELLLDEFEVRQKPASTLQRFNALQRVLAGWAEVGTRVFVVVEDAERLGEETLAELESITAGEGPDMPGCHLILMGTPELRKFLERPLLARLRQRVRRNLQLDAFGLDETRSYLAHCIGAAGAELGEVFADPVVDLIHERSGGIARVVNTLAETLLAAAEDTGSRPLGLETAREALREEFDWMDECPAGSGDGPAPDADEAPAASPDAPEAALESPAAEAVEASIPDLIQDTQPEMPALDEALFEQAAPADERPATPAEELAAWKEKTESTQPSLPVLGNPDEFADKPPAANLPGDNPYERGIVLEPRAPEPLSKSADPADSQMVRELDNALRPDTQFLETLEEPHEATAETTPGEPAAAPPEPQAGAQAPDLDDSLPTLSDTVVTRALDPGMLPESGDVEDAPAADTAATSAPQSLPTSEPAEMSCSAADAADVLAAPEPMTAAPEPVMPTPSEREAPQPAAASVAKTEQAAPASSPNAAAAAPAPKPAAPAQPEAALPEPAPASPAPVSATATIDAIATPDQDAGLASGEPTSPEATITDSDSGPVNEDAVDAETETGFTLSLEETAERAGPVNGQAMAPQDDQVGAAVEPNDSGDLPDLSLMPEITLDDTLNKHQRDAQAKLDDEARRLEASKGEAEAAAEAAEDARKKERLKSLAARVQNARSIEDIIDDTAAETLFGEEFSQMAAAVTAMHDIKLAGDAAPDDVLLAEPAPASNDARIDAPPPETPPASAAPSPNAAAAAKPAVTEKPAAPTPRPRPDAPAPALDASAAQRLEMVRRLNQKAGKPMPKVPEPAGEEIVLGDDDDSPTASGPKPDRIEDQFGTSMTAKLRALSAENIKQMQEAEEPEEKKRGLFARFRRS